jgi:FG-GAP repeat
MKPIFRSLRSGSRYSLPLLASVLVFSLIPTAAAQADWVEQMKLRPVEDCGFFGQAAAMEGDRAALGAPGSQDAAYLFRFDGWAWQEEAELVADDGRLGDFGWSISLSGDAVVVGAPGYYSGDSAGAAYVFRYNGSAWAQETKIQPADGESGEHFGSCVAMSGDALVVGAHLDDDNGSQSGSAYVYRFDGQQWNQEQKLLASDAEVSDWFGCSVAIDGSIVLVGANGCRVGDESGAGAAYVFRHDGTAWVEEAIIAASGGSHLDAFGGSVALAGDTALIGATGNDDAAFDAGAAYVFQHDGLDWSQQQLLASDGEDYDCFGTSVAFDGTTAVVGVPSSDDGGDKAGSAYVFRFDGVTWVEEKKLLASDGAEEDEFGRSVAVSGDTVMIGARGDRGDNGYTKVGSAYAFGPAPLPCRGDLDADGDTDQADLGILLAAYNTSGLGDLDGDDDTDQADLGVLLADYGCGA